MLVACNADTYEGKLEKAGYSVSVSKNGSTAVKTIEAGMSLDGGYDGGVEWIVSGTNTDEGIVTIIKFEKTADAKKFVETLSDDESEYVDRQFSYVFIGTSEKALKAAK